MNDDIQYTHSEHCWAAGHYDCAVKKIAELEAEVERLRADAERYRWLRNAQTGKAVNCVASSAFPAWLNGPELDAAIDVERGAREI